MNSGGQTDRGPRHYLRVLARRKYVFLLALVLVPATALVQSLRQGDLYEASARVISSSRPVSSPLLGAYSPAVAKRVLAKVPVPGETVQDLLRATTVSTEESANSDPSLDPYRAEPGRDHVQRSPARTGPRAPTRERVRTPAHALSPWPRRGAAQGSHRDRRAPDRGRPCPGRAARGPRRSPRAAAHAPGAADVPGARCGTRDLSREGRAAPGSEPSVGDRAGRAPGTWAGIALGGVRLSLRVRGRGGDGDWHAAPGPPSLPSEQAFRRRRPRGSRQHRGRGFSLTPRQCGVLQQTTACSNDHGGGCPTG